MTLEFQNFVYWIRAEVKNEMPKEMRKDPLLNRLNLHGPLGKDHQTLRDTYYNARDEKAIKHKRKEIKRAYDCICSGNSGLFGRLDDTPKELNVICPVINKILSDNP